MLRVVFALDDLSPAPVAGPVVPGRRVDAVVGAAVDADPPAGQPLEHDVGRHLDVDHQVDAPGTEHAVERLGLLHVARVAVQEKAALRVVLGQPLADQPVHDVVGHQLTGVHELFGLPAELGARLGGRTEDLARRDVRDHVVA